MSDIEIEIDGKPLKAKPNSMVIQVADEAGIYIPRFCYHKHLSVAANCRMCLVDVEKSPKALPACATPVAPGMKVFTRSAKALAAQKAVMEFLLINHPLDCPICDQGGECELQDLSMGYGSPDSYYHLGKRSVKDDSIGPLIATDMTRCIQCTRCVRFGEEVAGLRELGAIGRGEHMEISTYVQHAMHSEVSGNIIDLCPVGALTSKPYRFTARSWELQQFPSIAPHDCVGSHINVHVRRGKVMRVVPKENPDINETWISDRDRYSYEGLYHPDRLTKPRIKKQGQWHEVTWETALETATKRLQHVLHDHGADQLGALISPQSTTEECFLLQKIMRQLGSENIDHRLRQVDMSDQAALPLYPQLHQTMAELEENQCILLIGANPQKEQPAAGLRIRKATRKGAEVVAVNMLDHRFHFPVAAKKIAAPHAFVEAVAALVQAMDASALDQTVDVSDIDHAIVKKLKQYNKISIILGAAAQQHPEAASLRFLAQRLGQLTGATVGVLTEGANAAGAWIAGALPHRAIAGVPMSKPGLDAMSMLQASLKAYILFNVEPDLDCANPVAATKALQQAECVVAFSAYVNPVIEEHADILLPIAPFTETSGTLVNAASQWQSFAGVATPLGESRPGWKVLRVLANFLQLEGFDFASSEEVLHDIKRLIAELVPASAQNVVLPSRSISLKKSEHKLSRIGDVPIYATDSVVRRAKALQATQAILEGDVAAARFHPLTAQRWSIATNKPVRVKQQGHEISLPVLCDERVPLDGVLIAAGISAASEFSELFGLVEVYQ